jgi:hypothetical protein
MVGARAKPGVSGMVEMRIAHAPIPTDVARSFCSRFVARQNDFYCLFYLEDQFILMLGPVLD